MSVKEKEKVRFTHFLSRLLSRLLSLPGACIFICLDHPSFLSSFFPFKDFVSFFFLSQRETFQMSKVFQVSHTFSDPADLFSSSSVKCFEGIRK